ncbi:prepilin-type N-terminal cleavage/methylation domain-containing protein [Arenimonas sp.]|uniref:type IV pilus modification PilV family protein n=1 Tax=Arenimonas sp. TaxID=1872635 RepID=UPI0035B2A2F8
MSRRGAAGFTLLEAIVAMVVFAMGALALYQWQATSLSALSRVDVQARRLDVAHDALEALRSVNPMAEPEGERALGDYTLYWQANPVEPRRTGLSQAGYPSLFDVGLYTVDAWVVAGGTELTRFQVRQVGWEQVRIARDDE